MPENVLFDKILGLTEIMFGIVPKRFSVHIDLMYTVFRDHAQMFFMLFQSSVKLV